MWIPANEVPQADSLEDVLESVIAVAEGAETYQDIARAIGKVERQGRYYRRATEILGFTHRADTNQSVLTASGRQYVSAGTSERRRMAEQAVLNATLFQRIIPFLEAHSTDGVTREELETFVETVTEPTGDTMIPRRTSTVTAWLNALGLVQDHQGKYYFHIPSEIDIIDYREDSEPLLPTVFDLEEYRETAERVALSAGQLAYEVDVAQRERAVSAHTMLTNLTAQKLRRYGALPRRNRYIDLAASIQGQQFIFEMKSTNATNAHAQIRQGISQLYEYRYRQNASSARLVLVIENRLPRDLEWIEAYLRVDREIALIWDGDRHSLHCNPLLYKQFGFLVEDDSSN